MPALSALRAARCLGGTAVTTGLGVLAHVLAAGHPPDVGAVAVIGTLLAAAWGAATRRRLSVVELLALLALGQVVVHLVLALPTHLPAHAGHMGEAPAAGVLPGEAMGAAHVVATFAAAAVLGTGERLAAMLVELLRPLVRPVALPAPLVLARPRRPAQRPVLLRWQVLLLDLARRGPPLPPPAVRPSR